MYMYMCVFLCVCVWKVSITNKSQMCEDLYMCADCSEERRKGSGCSDRLLVNTGDTPELVFIDTKVGEAWHYIRICFHTPYKLA